MEYLDKLNIRIENPDLLRVAFTHSSYINEHGGEDYERLEFLGDAILQIIVSEYLYLNTKLDEGEMSKTRSRFVCEAALANYSKDIGLDKEIIVGQGIISHISDAIVADVFESFLGAVYLNAGIEAAKKVVYDVAIPYIKQEHYFISDYKSILQEMMQTTKQSLKYVVTKQTGPAHNRLFEVVVKIDDIVYGKGIGKNKKEAEQNAAQDAFNKSARVGK